VVRLGGEGLSAALPWLAAGELLSVGSGTTFGFGRIELDVGASAPDKPALRPAPQIEVA
jgi:hypothetical protein